MPVGLKRNLGLTSAVLITVGSVIGSGIFMKPLDIARSLPDPLWIQGAWVGLGLVCLCGALAYAELGTMFPEAGGQYAFLREGWGRFPAFLYGWALFLVINTGTMSALAVAFSDWLSTLVPLGETARFAVAAGMILLLALVNHFGVNWGALLQNLSTLAKLLSLGVLVGAGFLVGSATGGAPAAAAATEPARGFLPGLVAAAVALFWAYEGWHQLPFNAAELRRPERHLPLGLVLGVLILIAVYVAVNAAYFHLVPYEEMKTLGAEVEVPRTAMERIFGAPGANLLALMVCLSVFGAANPNLLSTSRAFYAMARDGLGLQALTRIHARHRTPVVAIWTQAIWAVLLILVMKRFHDLTDFVVFAALIFYALTVAAVYVLRHRSPDRPRPHRTWGYPWTPAIFIVAVLFVDVQTLLDPAMRLNALKGLAILAAGVPAYFLFVRRRRAAASGGGDG